MNPERWARLKTLFHGALEQPAPERRAWLAREAGADEALVRDAEGLVHAHETAGGFLEQAAVVEPEDLFAMPAAFGPYRVLQEIGRGGMGIVYLAEDERLGRRVAIKALPPHVADEPERRERLRREARAAATISNPAVASVYALEEIEGQLLLVAEYVPGHTLREELRTGPLAPDRALTIAGEVAVALSAAHDAGVVHRDLKPENILVTEYGRIKVVDFGIAIVEGAGAGWQTLTGQILGTPAYMAPEQLTGGRGDARADVWAFGVLLAEMLTGRHPHAPAGERDDAPALPSRAAAIVSKCLQTDPAARYPSARELLRDLSATANGGLQGTAGLQAAPSAAAFGSARWWWEFHQGMTALVYALLLFPAWNARVLMGGAAGRAFFMLTLAAVIVSATLRLHLWFTARFYPTELRWVRARVVRWIHAADWLFSATLVAGGLLIGDERALAIVLIAFGIGAAVAFLVIERATTRAAFRSEDSA